MDTKPSPRPRPRPSRLFSTAAFSPLLLHHSITKQPCIYLCDYLIHNHLSHYHSTDSLKIPILFGLPTVSWTSLVAQMVKTLPTMQETWGRSLCWEDPLEKEMAKHASLPACRILLQRSLAGYSPWGCKELDTIEQLTHTLYSQPLV